MLINRHSDLWGRCKFINPSRFYLLALLLIFIIRWSHRLFNATLWAEDGALFLQDAFKYGLESLYLPYSGYFHTVPRIIAYVSSLLPAILIPHFIVILCFVITYYIISVLLKSDYEWILPEVHFRGVFTLLIAIAPGTTEVFGNIANLHWILYLYLGLLGFRSINYSYHLLDYVFASLAVFSEGATITLLPLFLIRLIFHVFKRRKKQLIYQESFIIFVILLMAFFNYLNKVSQTSFDVQSIFLILIYCKSILAESISFSWLYILPYTLMDKYWFIPSAGLFGIALFIVSKSFYLKEIIIFPIVLFMCFGLLPPMTVLARENTFDLIYTHSGHGWQPLSWLNFRYSFIPSVSGYFFWIWIISLIYKYYNTIAVYLSILILLLSFVFCLKSYFFIKPYSENIWIINSKKIDDVRNNDSLKSIEISIEPSNWKVKIGNGDLIINPD
ncbi:MAG: hypothetical protein IPO21_07435 [Bacteroidales bacterium]|nr:hypothetical protein [Bacteroidales bacterium]